MSRHSEAQSAEESSRGVRRQWRINFGRDAFATRLMPKLFGRRWLQPAAGAPALSEAEGFAKRTRAKTTSVGDGAPIRYTSRRLQPRPFSVSITSCFISALPRASSPSTTPRRSLSDRFWLSFHFPSSRVIRISSPTIPLMIDAI